MNWFKKYGITYVPIQPEGFIVTLLAILFMVPAGIVTFRNGHSASDGPYRLFAYGTCTAFWWK